MQKTDQNLKDLEKRVHVLIHRLQELNQSPAAEAGIRDPGLYQDLPLLQGIEAHPSPGLEKLLRERREVREGIRRIMERIEHYLE